MLVKYLNPRLVRSPPVFGNSPRSKKEVDEAIEFHRNQIREERQSMSGIHDEPLQFWRTNETNEESGSFDPFAIDPYVSQSAKTTNHWESEKMARFKNYPKLAKKPAKDTRIDLVFQLVDEIARGLHTAKGLPPQKRDSNATKERHAQITKFVEAGGYQPEDYFKAARDFAEINFGYTIFEGNDIPVQWDANFVRNAGDTHMALLYETAEALDSVKFPSTMSAKWRNIASDTSLEEQQRAKHAIRRNRRVRASRPCGGS
jgi:hypothetical protein